jgi:hypothetical protein
MRTEKIGKYINRATGKVYEVVKRTKLVNMSPLSGGGVTLDGSVDFITSCGINLNPKSDDDSVFEMLEINGTIHRQ